MELSAPIYYLKHQAKILSRANNVPLHEALNIIANNEGFSNWSLLASKASSQNLANKIRSNLSLGDLVLLGARPGHGKTTLSLKLVVEAMKSGNRGAFFSLESSENDILNRFKNIGEDLKKFHAKFDFFLSDLISAEYIIMKLSTAPVGTFVVIDYLQLLDQKRDNPELIIQISALKEFVRNKQLIMVFISQIDRFFDSSEGVCPSLDDVRLPNSLDLNLFNKACFLNDGNVELTGIS